MPILPFGGVWEKNPPGRQRQGRWVPKNRPKIPRQTGSKKLSTIAGCHKSRTFGGGGLVEAQRRPAVAQRAKAGPAACKKHVRLGGRRSARGDPFPILVPGPTRESVGHSLAGPEGPVQGPQDQPASPPARRPGEQSCLPVRPRTPRESCHRIPLCGRRWFYSSRHSSSTYRASGRLRKSSRFSSSSRNLPRRFDSCELVHQLAHALQKA